MAKHINGICQDCGHETEAHHFCDGCQGCFCAQPYPGTHECPGMLVDVACEACGEELTEREAERAECGHCGAKGEACHGPLAPREAPAGKPATEFLESEGSLFWSPEDGAEARLGIDDLFSREALERGKLY
jgi:hypothetical protein